MVDPWMASCILLASRTAWNIGKGVCNVGLIRINHSFLVTCNLDFRGIIARRLVASLNALLSFFTPRAPMPVYSFSNRGKWAPWRICRSSLRSGVG